jgi:hypothetical protein
MWTALFHAGAALAQVSVSGPPHGKVELTYERLTGRARGFVRKALATLMRRARGAE